MPSTRHGNGLSRPALDRSKQREFFGSADGMIDYRVFCDLSMRTLGQPIGILAPLIDYSAPPRGTELPAAPSAVPVRPASEEAGQRSRAIIPGDDPGDQQPPNQSKPLLPRARTAPACPGTEANQTASRSRRGYVSPDGKGIGFAGQSVARFLHAAQATFRHL